jgi:hypothetical protein
VCWAKDTGAEHRLRSSGRRRGSISSSAMNCEEQ